jgi:hypothetical protein
MIISGKMMYLSPIDYSDPNFLKMPDNTEGTHGISLGTKLTPTNQ